jgi:adenylate kinase
MGLNVVMLGAPGAGKGTQAERFARRRGLPKISTGDILRQGVQDRLPVALLAKATMDRGELVDDETMVAIVRERLVRPDTDQGFVLDGFPRTVSQARALDTIMEDRGKGPLLIVDIVVPDEDLVRRLAMRRICSKCGKNAEPVDTVETTCQRCGGTLVHRVDDSEDVVLERLRVYASATRPLVEFYSERPTFRALNGAQPPDRVAQELDAAITEATVPAASVASEARGAVGR